MKGDKNWILLKEAIANRFFRDSHLLEIWKNHLCPSMGPNKGSVPMDSGETSRRLCTCAIVSAFVTDGQFISLFSVFAGILD
jgi:hypothetical protein